MNPTALDAAVRRFPELLRLARRGTDFLCREALRAAVREREAAIRAEYWRVVGEMGRDRENLSSDRKTIDNTRA